ncbi:histone H1-like [Camellia sinensis]|uniref:histone H1-like n=1 Tax=Camellia sinensis TaxID=4442 RepID=UPI001035B166|nr:histone H1-like [Camellia sinensis]
MISEAISSLKDRTGSSQPAIAKFMEEKYSSLLPPNFKKMLLIQLKKFVKSEKLVKIKNSYEVSTSENVKLVTAAAAASIKEFEKTNKAVVKNGEKTKRLSQVKTPKALKKKKKKVSTPCKEELIQVGQG